MIKVHEIPHFTSILQNLRAGDQFNNFVPISQQFLLKSLLSGMQMMHSNHSRFLFNFPVYFLHALKLVKLAMSQAQSMVTTWAQSYRLLAGIWK